MCMEHPEFEQYREEAERRGVIEKSEETPKNTPSKEHKKRTEDAQGDLDAVREGHDDLDPSAPTHI